MIVGPHQLFIVVALCPGVLCRCWSGFDPLPRRLPLQVSPPLGSLLVTLPLLLLQTQLLQLLPEHTHTHTHTGTDFDTSIRYEVQGFYQSHSYI